MEGSGFRTAVKVRERPRPKTIFGRAVAGLSTVFRKKDEEHVQRRATTVFQKLAADCERAKGDKVVATTHLLKKLLVTQDVSRAEAQELEPGETTDIIFASAIIVFSEDNGPVGKKAGRMAQAMLNSVSDDTVAQSLSYEGLTRVITRGVREGRLERAARIMATMCCRVAHTQERLVSDITSVMRNVQSRGAEAQQNAADIFLNAMDRRVVEAVA